MVKKNYSQSSELQQLIDWDAIMPMERRAGGHDEHRRYTNDYLCAPCALILGGTWPDGHAATMHDGLCSRCRSKAALSHHDDWNWPGQKDYPGRD